MPVTVIKAFCTVLVCLHYVCSNNKERWEEAFQEVHPSNSLHSGQSFGCVSDVPSEIFLDIMTANICHFSINGSHLLSPLWKAGDASVEWLNRLCNKLISLSDFGAEATDSVTTLLVYSESHCRRMHWLQLVSLLRVHTVSSQMKQILSTFVTWTYTSDDIIPDTPWSWQTSSYDNCYTFSHSCANRLSSHTLL